VLKTCAACTKIIAVTTKGGRCDECRRDYDRQRRQWRGKTAARGYDAAWRRMVALAIRAHPYCTDCGLVGSGDNPLTGDHIVPRVDGGQNTPSNIAVRCRVCNSRRGAGQVGGGSTF
jgi:5-methylcytosine-specific restriction endonuclease McrA